MYETIPSHYDLHLIALSLIIAVIASYTALDLAGRVTPASSFQSRLIWVIGGAVAMGTGIWSMHFIAMLAFQLPIPITYDVTITILSLLDAIIASGLALLLLSRPTLGVRLFLGGSIVMGLAIASMHYLGMAAVKVPAAIHYDPFLVALSIAIAIGASGTALWLAFRFRDPIQGRVDGRKILSAGVMGLAISGMHYTGMWATCFTRVSAAQQQITTGLDQGWLAAQIGICTLIFLLATLITSGFESRLTQQEVRQATLQESEKRFRSLVREMPVGVLLLDLAGTIVWSNPMATDWLNLSQADSQGQKIPQNLLNEAGKPFEHDHNPIQQALIHRQPIHNQVVGWQTPQSRLLWLLLHVDPQLSEDNTVERFICTFSNITQRKQAEMALQESAHREKAIAKVIQRMRQTLDIYTIFQTTTQELRQVLKCERVAIYRFYPDWSGEFVAESVETGWKHLIEGTESEADLNAGFVDNERCIIKSLSLLNAQTLNQPVRDTYLQKNQGGVYGRGTSYRVVEDIYNANFTPCYIALLEEFQAKAYIIVPIFCGSKLWGLLASYQNSSTRFWNEAEINITLQISTQLGVALQQVELLVQTQQQSEALQQAAFAADAANRAKSEFLAKMSHELRTPLNAILGFAQMMNHDLLLSAEHRQNLEIINRAGEHLLDLINDILEMSKIEAGQITLNETTFDLYNLLNTLKELLSFKAETKGLQLILDYQSDLPQYIQTDEGKLRQVLINLLSNSIKFTEKGEVKLQVKLGTDNHLFFAIEDTGVGISPEEISLLFEAFGQTEAGRKSGQGTGLGLAISQKFVQLMGGNIQVETQVGSGSLFQFNIPIQVSTSVPQLASQRRVLGLAAGQPNYRILVVEDVRVNRLLLVKLFQKVGFCVQEAENGKEAIRLWESWQPHLIWMDIQMPVLNGYEATQQIKARQQQAVKPDLYHDGKGVLETIKAPEIRHQTIIIAITANAFDEDRKAVLEAGCDDFVSKPFREEILLAKMQEYLGVEYLYEEGEKKQKQAFSVESTLAQPLESYLKQMPKDWVKRVYQAADECSDDQIFQLIKEIPPEAAPLAEALTDLASYFLFDDLMELIKVTE